MRATQLAIFSVLALFLIGIGAYAVSEFREPVAEPGEIVPKSFGENPAELTCPEPGAVPLPPAEVTVTVLNGTSRGGLAGEVTGQFSERGFMVGDAGNTRNATAAATIVHGPSGYLAAQSVHVHVPGATLRMDEREGAEVSLLLGDEFSGLEKEATAAAGLEKAVEIPEGCPTG